MTDLHNNNLFYYFLVANFDRFSKLANNEYIYFFNRKTALDYLN